MLVNLSKRNEKIKKEEIIMAEHGPKITIPLPLFSISNKI